MTSNSSIGANIVAPGGFNVSFACWSTAECAVSLLCANLALLRPIFTNAYNKLSIAHGKSAPPGSDVVGLKQMQTSSNTEQHSVSIPPILPVSPLQVPQSRDWPLEIEKGETQPRGMV